MVTIAQMLPIPDAEAVGAGGQDCRVVRTKHHSARLCSVPRHQQLRRNCGFRFTFTDVQRTSLYAVVLQQRHNLWKTNLTMTTTTTTTTTTSV